MLSEVTQELGKKLLNISRSVVDKVLFNISPSIILQ